MQKLSWQPEHDALLIKNWGILSAAKIADLLNKELGAGVTRMSVIGRAHRIGLHRLNGSLPKNPAKPVKIIRVPRFMLPEAISAPIPAELNTLDWWDLNVEFFDLQPWHCREVVGQDGSTALFCGHAEIGRSYCERHHLKNYMKLPPKTGRPFNPFVLSRAA